MGVGGHVQTLRGGCACTRGDAHGAVPVGLHAGGRVRGREACPHCPRLCVAPAHKPGAATRRRRDCARPQGVPIPRASRMCPQLWATGAGGRGGGGGGAPVHPRTGGCAPLPFARTTPATRACTPHGQTGEGGGAPTRAPVLAHPSLPLAHAPTHGQTGEERGVAHPRVLPFSRAPPSRSLAPPSCSRAHPLPFARTPCRSCMPPPPVRMHPPAPGGAPACPPIHAHPLPPARACTPRPSYG
jgi:hypothetical protein